ncbi:MAG: response regulator transcription factor [Candidatus Omnitrophota bacterium]
MKILVVEDDNNILLGIVDNLKIEGYSVVISRDGQAALKQVEERNPDLIILDVMLPKMTGFEVCRQLKSRGVNTPIIILSARGEEADKVLGLELGADDYITKPFSPRELLERVKAVLRRVERQKSPVEIYCFGEVRVDFRRREVNILSRGIIGSKNGELVKLTNAEFRILSLLVSCRGEPVSRHKILADIWAEDVTTRTVDTHIWHLREKLEPDPSRPEHIITVHRIGYKLL